MDTNLCKPSHCCLLQERHCLLKPVPFIFRTVAQEASSVAVLCHGVTAAGRTVVIESCLETEKHLCESGNTCPQTWHDSLLARTSLTSLSRPIISCTCLPWQPSHTSPLKNTRSFKWDSGLPVYESPLTTSAFSSQNSEFWRGWHWANNTKAYVVPVGICTITPNRQSLQIFSATGCWLRPACTRWQAVVEVRKQDGLWCKVLGCAVVF